MQQTTALEQAVSRIDQHLRWARGFKVPGQGAAELRWASHVVAEHRPGCAALTEDADRLLGEHVALRSPQLLTIFEQLVHAPH